MGGGSNLPGLADFAKEKLELPVKIGVVKGVSGLHDIVSSPEHATAVGLMMLDALLNGSGSGQRPDHMVSTGILGKLKRVVFR